MADNGNGAKAFGGVMAIGMLATWGWMLWQAQNSNVENLSTLLDQRITTLERSVLSHHAGPPHAQAMTQMAQLDQKFVEVETQFRNLDERTLRIETGSKESTALLFVRMEKDLTAARELAKAELMSLVDRVDSAERDLDSRAGLRFNMPDYERLILPRLEAMEKTIKERHP